MPPAGRKQGRGDLNDRQWKLIESLFPAQRRGGMWNDHRLMFDEILWILRTGSPWRDLPERYGKWGSVYPLAEGRDVRPCAQGPADPAGQGRVHRLGSVVRGWQQRACVTRRGGRFQKSEELPGKQRDHALGRSRGGWGSKFHLVVDGNALPLAAIITAGQAHESKAFVELMEKVRPPRWTGWPLKVAGDKGYSYPRVRGWLERRGIVQVIPQRSDQIRHEGKRPLDRHAYRRRAKVENCVGWLKENRRVGTRYDKLAASFLTFVNLAIIRRYLRILAPDDPSDRT